MKCTKHIIECHCVLPQFRSRPKPIYHKFIVFSEIDDSDTVIPKHAQCNNCGVVHFITDICKSEIVAGKEDLASITTIDDIKLMISADTVQVLDNYNCDLPTWEQVLYILQNKDWDSFVVLNKETVNDEIHGKLLRFLEGGRLKIEPFISRTLIEPEKL